MPAKKKTTETAKAISDGDRFHAKKAAVYMRRCNAISADEAKALIAEIEKKTV